MNAPPFSLCGIGFLAIGFALIFVVLFVMVIVHVLRDGIKRLKEIK